MTFAVRKPGAVESVAENFSDGVVAPVFWYLLLGLPGLAGFVSEVTVFLGTFHHHEFLHHPHFRPMLLHRR